MRDDMQDRLAVLEAGAFAEAEARIHDHTVPPAQLADAELEAFAVPGATRAERERWVLDARADELYADRLARRAAADPHYAAHLAWQAAERRVWREQAWRRMRAPTEREWAARGLPPKLWGAVADFAEVVNANAKRERPGLVCHAVRRDRRASVAPSHRRAACRRTSRRGAGRPARRARGASRARSGDDGAGEPPPPGPERRGGCPEASR